MTETLTKPGAQYLAGIIQTYWSRRGHMPMVRIEPISKGYRKLSRDGIIGAAYQVRSDMLNGLPREIVNNVVEVRLPGSNDIHQPLHVVRPDAALPGEHEPDHALGDAEVAGERQFPALAV